MATAEAFFLLGPPRPTSSLYLLLFRVASHACTMHSFLTMIDFGMDHRSLP